MDFHGLMAPSVSLTPFLDLPHTLEFRIYQRKTWPRVCVSRLASLISYRYVLTYYLPPLLVLNFYFISILVCLVLP